MPAVSLPLRQRVQPRRTHQGAHRVLEDRRSDGRRKPADDYREGRAGRAPAHIDAAEAHKSPISDTKTDEAVAEGRPQPIIEKEEQVELPPIWMLLTANDKIQPLE